MFLRKNTGSLCERVTVNSKKKDDAVFFNAVFKPLKLGLVISDQEEHARFRKEL